MKIQILILLTIILSFSCSKKKEFKISADNKIYDAAWQKFNSKIDSFEKIIEVDYFTSKDTTKQIDFLKILGDSVKMNQMNSRFAIYFKTPLNDYFSELNIPYHVKNNKKNVIHFSIFELNKYIELEIYENELLYSWQEDSIKSIVINAELFNKASTNCTCSENDIINNIFLDKITTQNFRKVYRLDISSGNKYQYCWKFFNSDDDIVLNQLLNIIEEENKPKSTY